MEKTIEHFFNERNEGIFVGSLTKEEKKWLNGRTFYPCYYYHMLTTTLDFNYCYQSNEYSTSNALLPSKVDIHKIQLKYSFPSNLADSFSIISKYSLISLLIKGRNTYNVTSKNSFLKNYLKGDSFIKEIYSMFIDPEFDPIISGNLNMEKYEIDIQFNLIRFKPEIFYLIEKFILDFEQQYG